MQKDSKDAEIIFTYRLVDGTKYGLSTGTKTWDLHKRVL